MRFVRLLLRECACESNSLPAFYRHPQLPGGRNWQQSSPLESLKRKRIFLTVFSGEDCIFATILNNRSVKKGHGRRSDGNRANRSIRDP